MTVLQDVSKTEEYKAWALWRYFQLMEEHPEEFAVSDDGFISIVTDPNIIARFEAENPSKIIGVVYESPWYLVVVDLIDSGDGKYYTYERVMNATPGGAVILPITDDGQIVLLRRFRHASRHECLELPRGFGKPGETAKQTAHREASEEIHADDSEPVYLGEVIADSGLCGNKVSVYMFKVHDYQTTYGHEGIIEAIAVTPAEMETLIKSGSIRDGYTLSAWAKYRARERHAALSTKSVS